MGFVCETGDVPPCTFRVLLGIEKPRKPSVYAGLRGTYNYSHSIVPLGLGVRSYKTRLTPGTSWVIRQVIC